MLGFPGTPSTSAVRPPIFAGPILRHSRRANAFSKVDLVSGEGDSDGAGEGVAAGSCAKIRAVVCAKRKTNRHRPTTRLERTILFLLKLRNEYNCGNRD